MEYTDILVERRNHVAYITINRPEKMNAFRGRTCDEEARSGWEMLEKFDNCRIRFKRKTEHRDRDQQRDIDPYRTQVGMTSGQLGFLITAVVFLGTGALLAVIAFFAN